MIIHRKRQEVPGLNTTSTADISFMLLIFFLVTTSMDVDKGLARQLPAPQKKEMQETNVDKSTLMALHLMAGNKLLVNDKPTDIGHLKDEAVRFIKRMGKRHVISIESDRDADYNLYFQSQNQLMEAYGELRNEYAQAKYGKRYASLSKQQKDKVRQALPIRITESYANAEVLQDKDVSMEAEEKKGGKE